MCTWHCSPDSEDYNKHVRKQMKGFYAPLAEVGLAGEPPLTLA